MKVIITNKFTVVQNPSTNILHQLKTSMSYIDKAKQYQLRRMEKNPFQKNSGYIKQLRKEVECCLVKELDGGHVAFNSGLSYQIESGAIQIEDRRSETGTTISLPWKKKPFDPRPYQDEAIEACVNSWRGVINFATGLGKTLTAVHLLRRLKRNGLIIALNSASAALISAYCSRAFCSSCPSRAIG